MNRDLTEGKPGTVLRRFSLPLFVSVMFQQLYNIADSVIAGKFAGEEALAAVGASYPVTMLFMAVAIGCNIGCSVVISRLFGAREYRGMKTAVSTSLIASVVLSLALTGAGLAASGAIMRLIRTPANIFDDGVLYLRIYIGGFLFLFLYNICTGVFQSLGDSRTPLLFLIGSSLGNMALDILFVAGFHWGVAGVAIATFLAQGVACLLCFVALLHRLRQVPADSFARFSPAMLGEIGRIALPSVLQQSFISVGNMLIQGLVNGFGSSVIAGYAAAVKLNTFTITSFTTLANGLSNFTAQNIGAAKTARVRQGWRSGCLLALCVAVPFFLVFFFGCDGCLRLFMKEESAPALEAGRAFLRTAAPFYPIIAIKLMTDGILRGAGSMLRFMTATFADLILRVVLSFALAVPFGSGGIWMSWPIGWTVAALLSLLFYRRGQWVPKTAAACPEQETAYIAEPDTVL